MISFFTKKLHFFQTSLNLVSDGPGYCSELRRRQKYANLPRTSNKRLPDPKSSYFSVYFHILFSISNTCRLIRMTAFCTKEISTTWLSWSWMWPDWSKPTGKDKIRKIGRLSSQKKSIFGLF